MTSEEAWAALGILALIAVALAAIVYVLVHCTDEHGN